MVKPHLEILSEELAVCRLSAGAPFPEGLLKHTFCSITQTGDEMSIVLPEDHIPEGCQAEARWRAIKVQGPLAFELTGILASLCVPLAQANISIFAISTFDTDYLLVRSGNLTKAVQVLIESGFNFTP